MKRIYLIFIMSCLFLSISKAQTLIEQIERAYSALDSASYINKIVLSYAKSLEKNEEESHKCESSDNGTEELKVDTDNFSGISKEFVQENPEIELKSGEKTDDEAQNDSGNNEIEEKTKEKKEKKIELPSFMR